MADDRPEGLLRARWPSERQTIEQSVALLRPDRTIEDALKEVAGLIALSLRLRPGPLEDAFEAESERIAGERLRAWIRDHRRGA